MSAAEPAKEPPWRVHPPLAVALVVALVLAFLVFRPFLLTFAVAGPVALLLAPLQKRLSRRIGGPGIAAALIVAMAAVALLIPILSYGLLLAQQASGLVEWARRLDPHAIEKVSQETLATRFPLLADLLRTWGGGNLMTVFWAVFSRGATLANQVGQKLAAELAAGVLDGVLFLMMLFFLLRDGPELREQLRGVSPFTREQEDALMEHLARTVKGVLLSMILVPLAQGLAAYIGFWIFDLPSRLLWAAMVVCAALIPLVGSPLAWVPAGVYLLVSGHGSMGRGVGMLLYGTFVISMIDNVLKPIVLRGAAQIHTLLGFLSILGGVFAFGPKGVIAGPVVLSLLLSAYRIYRFDVLRWRQEGAPPTA